MTQNKILNISIVLANLTPGGAERVLSFISQELDKSKFKCTMVIIGQIKDTAYTIEGIDVIYFEKPRVLNGIFNLFSYLRKNKPDIVLSAVAHVNTVTAYMSVFFPKIKFIAREVTILSVAEAMNKGKNDYFGFLVKKRFNFFDKIICQSQAMHDDMVENNNIKQEKLIIINNPISDGFNLKPVKQDSEMLRFITVGTFKKIKGHERIIKALGKLSIPFHYTLIGNGSEKENIFKLIEEVGIQDKITHIPFTSDVGDYLSESDIFLQGSYTEGFPNAVIESCAVGVPVIAFESPGGHNEIIIPGVNGYFAKTEDEYAETLKRIHDDFDFDIKKVRESATSRYGKDIILNKYEQLLENIVN